MEESYSLRRRQCEVLQRPYGRWFHPKRNRRHLKATKEQPIQPETDQMPEKSNTSATETSSHNSPQKSSSPETPVKLPVADLALTTQPVGVKQTRSGRVVKSPLYLKDYAR